MTAPTDRRSKAAFVADRFAPWFGQSVLDVGADECHVREHLDGGIRYVGVDRSASADITLDLEESSLPFEDLTFDCVLCLDVIEHVDNPHDLFDDVCRVSRRHIVIALPNAWSALWRVLRYGEYRPGRAMKFYGLPVDPPIDRHKWFFSSDEGVRFVTERGKRNGFEIVEHFRLDDSAPAPGLRGWAERFARRLLFAPTIESRLLDEGTTWIVLERRAA